MIVHKACERCGADLGLVYHNKKYCGKCYRLNRKDSSDRHRHANARPAAARRYGLTIDQYDALSEEQEHLCAICRQPNYKGMALSVDHDNTCCPRDIGKDNPSKPCGKCVRGLLCQTCNWGLGHFKDDPELLRRAIFYLTR